MAAGRADDRRARERRRGRVLLAGSIVLAAVMLVAWFPASALLSQRDALSSATAQLRDLRAQDRTLAEERATLNSPAEISRLAREEYQLVQPGQRVVQVLPPSGAPSNAGAGQAPYPGDPGLSKPVPPSAVALLPSGTTTTSPASATPSSSKVAAGSSQPGLWQRVAGTLEFWRR